MRLPCCEAQLKLKCEADLLEVEASTMLFHPDQIPVCLDSVGTLWDNCNTLPSDVGDVYRAEAPCRDIFVGTRQEGTNCSRDEQCAQPAADNEAMECSKTTGKCLHRWRASIHEPCTADELPFRPTCAPGLYCKTSVDPTVQPTCELAAHDVIPCDMSDAFPHCDVGSRCLNHRCFQSLALGQQCSNDYDCATYACNGNCVLSHTPIKRAECGFP
mgnify:FL=1